MAVEAVIRLGTFPIITAGPSTSRGGPGALDSVNVDIQCTEDWEAECTALGYTHLRRIPGFTSVWVQTLDDEPDGGSVRVRASCVGLARAGDKRQRTISAAGQQISVGPIERTVLVWSDDEQGEDAETGDPVEKVKRRVPKLDDEGEVVYKAITTPTGVGQRWDVREAIVQVRDRYFTTTRPSANVIGTVQVPPSAPTPPPYIWGGYNEPMRFRHPAGWVLDDRQIEELFWDGTNGLWAVEDLTGYYYASVPD
jgi:hypothetical protein